MYLYLFVYEIILYEYFVLYFIQSILKSFFIFSNLKMWKVPEHLDIQLFSKNAVIPTQATPGTGSYDLYSCESKVIAPHHQGKVYTDVAICIPTNWVGILLPCAGLVNHTKSNIINAPIHSDSRYISYNIIKFILFSIFYDIILYFLYTIL